MSFHELYTQLKGDCDGWIIQTVWFIFKISVFNISVFNISVFDLRFGSDSILDLIIIYSHNE